MSSIDTEAPMLCMPCGCDTDEELTEEDNNLRLILWKMAEGHYYPVDWSNIKQAQPGGTPGQVDPRAPPKEQSPCKACRACRRKNDWEHTRVIGECRYPWDEPWVPACPECQERKPRWKGDHTFRLGECVWADQHPRAFGPRARSSARPHEPEIKRDTEPTANIKAVDDDGVELGADNEERVAEADRLARDPHPPPVQVGGSSASNAGPNEPNEEEDDVGGQSADNVRRRGDGARRRGPDQSQRVRRTWRDDGDNPHSPHDWSNFDIGRVTRLLRTNRPGAPRLTLRKLHTTWCHATANR